MSPKVSIIVTVYNLKHFVGEAIDSVINQTYKNRECILVDDCSTDGSFDYIKTYISNISNEEVRNRFHVVQNDINSGVGKTFEAGLLRATGEYVADLDADDVWLENKLELQIDFMEKNPQYVMSCHDMIVVSQNLKEISKSLIHDVRKKDIESLQNDRIAFCKSGYCIGSSIVFKRDLIEYIVPFSKYIYQDIRMSNVANLVGEIGYLDHSLCLYRQHGNNNEGLADFISIGVSINALKIKRIKLRTRLSKNIGKYYNFYTDLKRVAGNVDDRLFAKYLNKRLVLYTLLMDFKNNKINRSQLLVNILKVGNWADIGTTVLYILNEKFN